MKPVDGWEVAIPWLGPIVGPQYCASCGGAPAVVDHVFVPSRPSLDLCLCEACARRRGGPKRRAILAGVIIFFLALGAAAVVDFGAGTFPQPIILVGPLVCTLLLGALVVFLLWPRPPAQPATAARHPVRFVKAEPNCTIFLCTHEAWAMDLARAYHGVVRTRPVREPFWEGLLALGPGVGMSVLMGYTIWNSEYPVLRIDNAGTEPLAIWVDGVSKVVAPPNEEGGVTRIRIPRATRMLGYSAVASSAPLHSLAIDLAQRGKPERNAFLYNPGQSACYYLDLTMYSSIGRIGPKPWELPVGSVGPQLIQEFYEFETVDHWFEDPPSQITVRNNERRFRMSLHWNQPCVALTRRGCSLAVRETLIACQDRAKEVEDDVRCIEEAERACGKR